MSEAIIPTPDAEAAVYRLFASGMRWRKRAEAAETALALLVADVEQYEAWQRPCYALDIARSVLKGALPPQEPAQSGEA